MWSANRCLVLLLILTLQSLRSSTAAGQWPSNSSANLPVGVDPHDNRSPKAVRDGAGGVIVVWEYTGPTTVGRDIYAQRLSSVGIPLWGPVGIAVTSAPDLQMRLSAESDGSGGVILAWLDYRNGLDADIYGQRLSANGNMMWGPNGLPLCTAVNDQIDVEIVADAGGGAVAVWRDMRADGSTADVFAQRISPTGNVLWGSNGLPVCEHPMDQERLHVSSTSDGAFAIVWDDGRSQGGSSQDVFAQRMTANGSVSWTLNGTPVCSAPRWQLNAQSAAIEGGRIIVAWEDDRTAANGRDVYAQQIDSLGVSSWIANGVPVCTTTHTQVRPQIISYGTGAIICWPDGRNGSSVYASRLDSNGVSIWATNGIAVCEAPGISDWPKIAGDQSGRIFVAWEDTRNTPSFYDVYAQRLDPAGSAIWPTNGVALSTATDSQSRISPVEDGYGGLIAVWEDWRDGGFLAQRYEVYAQHVNPDGSLGGPTGIDQPPRVNGLRFLRATPNPFASRTEVTFDSDVEGDVELLLYDVTGRLVFRGRKRAAHGENRYSIGVSRAGGHELPSGVYFLHLLSGSASAVSKLVITR
jgi:hypothetical protein